MSNLSEKAKRYDDNIRAVDNLQRQISRLKSENVLNIPPAVQKQIDNIQKQIDKITQETINMQR